MKRADRSRIARAIADAERGTSGRITVRLISDSGVDAFERAKHEFERAGLHRHDERNAALLLIAPKARAFAVIGDTALHDRVGDAFWQSAAEAMRSYFARDAVADGIVEGVRRVGDALRAHFSQESAP